MSKVKRALLLQLASLALGVAVVVYLARTYPLLSYVVQAQGWVRSLGPLGVALYPLLYAACNVLLLPAGVVAAGAGLFFGLAGGLLSNLVGYAVGAAVALALSRWLGRGWVRARFLRNPKWAALDEAVGREGWKMVFLAQVIPFAPSSLLNYLFGITRIPYWRGLFWSVVAQAPAMFVYAYLGTVTEVGLRILHGDRRPPAWETSLWGLGLVVTVVATTLLARLTTRLLREAEARARQEVRKTAPAFAEHTF